MANLVVKDIELCDHIEYDDRGFPRRGIPATLRMKGQDLFKTLLLRIGGDPGAYWLTIEADLPEPHPATVTFPNEHIVIRPGGDAWLTVDISLKNPPAGRHTLRVLLAGVELARLSFEIVRDA